MTFENRAYILFQTCKAFFTHFLAFKFADSSFTKTIITLYMYILFKSGQKHSKLKVLLRLICYTSTKKRTLQVQIIFLRIFKIEHELSL